MKFYWQNNREHHFLNFGFGIDLPDTYQKCAIYLVFGYIEVGVRFGVGN